MIIHGGLIVNSTSTQQLDIRIKAGLIVKLGAQLQPSSDDEKIIDATGKLVLPGGVDVHTHMDLQVGALRASDSFLTGSIAAACGGTTTIIDHMAFGPAGCDLQHQVDVYHQLAGGKAVIDYGFHGVIDRVDDAILQQMQALVNQGITSFKFYMTYDRRLDDLSIIRLLAEAKKLGVIICVHCENHAMLTYLRAKFIANGQTQPIYHARSRPDICESEAINRVLALAQLAGETSVYIVHTSSAAGLEAAVSSSNANAILETCPQYLVLDESRYLLPGAEGLKYIISPPLRSVKDNQALWSALIDGRIDVVGTDHCPFYFNGDKQLGKDDFTKCPNGAPGVELRLPILYSEGVIKRRMTVERLVQVFSSLPAKRFGLYPRKGVIAVGSDADVVILDPNKQVTVSREMLHENVDYTPYQGLELTGYPTTTISRGAVVMQDGAFTGSKSQGRYLQRKLPDFS